MTPLHIMMVTAEFAPFAKVGGLGDAASALAVELAARGHQVKVVLPLYGHLDRPGLGIRPLKKLPPLSLRVGYGMHDVEFHVLGRGGGRLQVVLIGCDDLYGRPGVYGDAAGEVFSDTVARAALHAQAALLLPRLLGWPVDVIHAHDAHAACALLYRDTWYAGRDVPGSGATVLTIHNLAHQEIHPTAATETLGLPASQAVYPGLLEFHGRINLMKAGVLAADRVNTVSPTYARETVTDAELGCGLQAVLAGRGDAYSGILNGTDYRLWNPARDPALPAGFTAGDLAGKAVCRRALMRELGLDAPEDGKGRLLRPLCGFVGRLVTQKGVDLLAPLLPRLAADGFTFALLGTGEPRLEKQLRKLASDHPQRVAYVDRYDDQLAHRIYAGCDVFLMPSLFEPCGLSQMYALRYGSPPVVRATGGLADTVVPFPEPGATGFMFQQGRDQELLACLRGVEKIWPDAKLWRAIQQRGMAVRFDWSSAAARYEAVYAEALAHRKEG